VRIFAKLFIPELQTKFYAKTSTKKLISRHWAKIKGSMAQRGSDLKAGQ
jgi:hypothetical protein